MNSHAIAQNSKNKLCDLIAEFPWHTTPFGAYKQWPSDLVCALNIILNSNQPMLIAWGDQRRILYNDAFSLLLTEDQHPRVLGQAFSEIWQNCENEFSDFMNNGFAQHQPSSTSCVKFIKKNQTQEIHLSASICPMHDQSGKLVGYFCPLTNASAAHYENLQNQDNLLSIIMNAPIGICIFEGKDHVFKLANDNYLNVLLGGRTDLLNKTVREAFPELEGQKVFQMMDQVYQSGKSYVGKEIMLIHDRGEQKNLRIYYDIVLLPVFDHENKVHGILGIGNDVTAYVLARKKLEATEFRLKTALEVAKIGTWEWDMKEELLACDDTAMQHYGISNSSNKLSAAEIQRVVFADDWERNCKISASAVRYGCDFRSEYRVIWPGGHVRWINSFAKIMRSRTGKPVRIIGASIDVTETKQTERASEKNLESAITARDEFISIASHELKTPITSLQLQIEMIKRKMLPLPETQFPKQQFLQAIDFSVKQINRLTNLIDDLLDITKIQSGNLGLNREKVALHNIVQQVLRYFANEFDNKSITVNVNIPETITGYWDASRMEQVLVNLLSNVVKYAPGNPLYIDALERNGWAIITLRDLGHGIPRDKLDFIFEQYGRVESSYHVHGLGLGLFVCKTIIEKHKGVIYAENHKGQGAKFVIKIPIHPEL